MSQKRFLACQWSTLLSQKIPWLHLLLGWLTDYILNSTKALDPWCHTFQRQFGTGGSHNFGSGGSFLEVTGYSRGHRGAGCFKCHITSPPELYTSVFYLEYYWRGESPLKRYIIMEERSQNWRVPTLLEFLSSFVPLSDDAGSNKKRLAAFLRWLGHSIPSTPHLAQRAISYKIYMVSYNIYTQRTKTFMT